MLKGMVAEVGGTTDHVGEPRLYQRVMDVRVPQEISAHTYSIILKQFAPKMPAG